MVKIQKVILRDGSIRYRARGVSVGKDSKTGRRAQRTITRRTRKEVEDELHRIGYAVRQGTYTKPWDGLVPELIDSYLQHGAIDWEANTRVSYANALQPAREWFAHRKARTVMREDIEAYRDHLLTKGRRRGGAAGTGLGARSVNLALGQLQAAWDLAEIDGRVARNPVRHVKRARHEPADRATWSEEQVRQFIAAAANDRLYACWLLSLLGLRRAEVLGLRWDNIDYTAGIIAIVRTRVLVNGQAIEKCPKSRRSARTLPLFEPVTSALKALRKRQLEERLAAGEAYTDSGYVAANEQGECFGIERFSDEFGRLCELARLPKCRLHDTRHSVNSLLEKLGVPDSLRAAWLGHTIAVNRGTYLHSRPEELAVISAALGQLFRAV